MSDIKVYAKRMLGNKIQLVEIEHDLGIAVEHNGKIFNISVDNYGQLTIRTGDQLIIRPSAANSIILDEGK